MDITISVTVEFVNLSSLCYILYMNTCMYLKKDTNFVRRECIWCRPIGTDGACAIKARKLRPKSPTLLQLKIKMF